MNKALARGSTAYKPSGKVIVVQSLGQEPHRIFAQKKRALLLETRQLEAIFKYVFKNGCTVASVEYDRTGRKQGVDFTEGIEGQRERNRLGSNTAKWTRFPPIGKLKAEERQHKVKLKKVKSAFRLETTEQAELLLPYVDAIIPDFFDVEEKATEAINILQEIGWEGF